MKEEKDILERIKEAGNPCSVPEGYFDSIENDVRKRISKPEEAGGVWRVARPALLLLAMFVVILAIGYGTMALTGTDRRTAENTESAESAESDFEYTGAEDASESEIDEMINYLADNYSSSDLEMFIIDLQTNQQQQL